MSTREQLWRRASGVHLWPLAWGLAAACALPWLLPERWDGSMDRSWLWLVWLSVLASTPFLLKKRWVALPFALALVAWTFTSLGLRARWERSLPVGFVELQGTLGSPWTIRGEQRAGSLCVNFPEALHGLELPLSLPADTEAPPPPGTPVRFRAELRSVDPAPIYLAERPLWRARSDRAPRRIHLRSAQLMEVLGPPSPSPLLGFQTWVRARFESLPLPEGTARDVWGALTLGIPPARDESFSAFAESGTIHTLVVSGLQVTLVMALVEALWRRLFRRGSSRASMAAGLLYSALVGFSAPVWRGLLMGLAWALGRGSGWKAPPALSLHGALILWILFRPASGCDPGFLLAWLALLGLLWCAEPLAGLLSPLLGRLAFPFARFAAPWLTTLPLLALFHGGAPLWGVVANLIVLPLVAFLTPICLLLTVIPVTGAVHALGWLLAWTGDHGVPVFARMVPLATGILWPWILLALGWLLLAHFHASFRRSRALCLSLVLLSAGLLVVRGTGRMPSTLSLEAIDVGQGDAMLLRVPDGDATLIDTGAHPWCARRIVRTLSRRGVREPLHLVITHPHGDHGGGWTTLARLWPLASTSLPSVADAQEQWNSIAPVLKFESRCPPFDPHVVAWPSQSPTSQPLSLDAVSVVRGDTWTRGAASFSVRWPPKPFRLTDPNMLSMILRIQWKDRELWLMGDALGLQERDLLDLGDPPFSTAHRLLKPGHHGSASASDPSWLAALRPDVVLVTAGKNNRFNFPDPESLERYRAVHVQATWIVGTASGVKVEAVSGGWEAEMGNGSKERVVE